MLSFAGTAGAQEYITNNYYYSPPIPGLNYGIAQGSIFIVRDPGPIEYIASQDVPLQTSLAGVTINVTVGGVTTQAIPYYVSANQITAILPSKTRVGSGTIAITSGGHTGSVPITVVESAFGLATVGGTGANGTAVAQDDSEGVEPEAGGARRIPRAGGYCWPSVQLPLAPVPSRNPCLLSQSNAAHPGDQLTFWGTGLGPVSRDETQYQTPADLTNIPIEVDIGGVSATVLYHGRSAYPGLDQIQVVVPAGVSGCNVSVVVTVGGVPSNLATIPVATGGRICSDPGLVPVTPAEYQTLLSQGNVNAGAIALAALTTTSAGTAAATGDSVYAEFEQFTSQGFTPDNFLTQASMGSCLVTYQGPPLLVPPFVRETFSGSLNAGPQINVDGPGGPLALPPFLPGVSLYLEPPGVSPDIVTSTGGAFTFDNGSGGPDVGPFVASLSEGLTMPLVWTNSSAITAIDRAKGQSVTWTGGTPGSHVNIFGYAPFIGLSGLGPPVTSYAYFTCSAPLSAGQFTVPAAVLGNLPPSSNGGMYVVAGNTQRFAAPGLDLGLLFFGAGSGIAVPFN